MHYYQFNIGDYASHTRHLTLMEDLAYRRLLDLYYLHERPLNECSTTVARLIGMSDFEAEVNTVLTEFFQHVDGGFINPRADKEITHFKNKQEQASRAGKASAARRSNVGSTDVQPTNNHKPITNNQEKKYKATVVAAPDGVRSDTWDAFIALRRAKKAPITKRAMDGIMAEAQKAGWSLDAALTEMAARGWTGFKAEWVAIDPTKKTAGERNKAVLGGLTRGLVGGGRDVKLID